MRHAKATTISGTRSHHRFERSGSSTFIGRRTFLGEPSIHVQFAQNSKPGVEFATLKPGVTIAYRYDEKWYLGSIMEVSVTDFRLLGLYLHTNIQLDRISCGFPSNR